MTTPKAHSSFISTSMRYLWVVVLLIGAVHAGLMNHTIDDTSPSIVYSHIPFQRCTSITCQASWTAGLYNGSSTITEGPITFSFIGNALYVFLAIFGTCTFNLDGNTVGTLNTTVPVVLFGPGESEGVHPVYTNTSIPDGPHTLMITPLDISPGNPTFIEFDYLVYTANSPRKSHVGAIIGGVIGGLVLTVGMLIAAFFMRRRRNRKRLFLRGIPLGDDDKPSIKLTPITGKN
ncbi:hypothetical protein C8R44DRAFT_792646 [Mycena epipterygia]|nr:hypothetical protein C8R44DRAFT_792646 [Mycena epipterygia]